MFTIEDAIEKCKDRAEICALHHMMTQAKEWKAITKWLEDLAYLPEKLSDKKYGQDRFSDAIYREGDTIYDLRDKQRELTINEIIVLLENIIDGDE